MTRIQCLLVVSFVLLHSVLGKQICDLKDVKCLTRGAKNVFKSLVAGTKTKPIDPLHTDKITGELGTLKYEITNSTLSGFKNCEVLMLKYDLEKMTYVYHLQCPELIFECYYVVKGDLGTTSLDGRGLASITIDDYLLIFQGNYKKFISEKDQKPRMLIKNSNLDTDLKGRLTVENKHLISGDKVKADFANAYFNDNYKATEKIFRSNILETIGAKFIKEVNTYLEIVPLDEVLPRDQKDWILA